MTDLLLFNCPVKKQGSRGAHAAPGCPMRCLLIIMLTFFFSLAGFTLGHLDHEGAPGKGGGIGKGGGYEYDRRSLFQENNLFTKSSVEHFQNKCDQVNHKLGLHSVQLLSHVKSNHSLLLKSQNLIA